jgi:hypothetical protein
LSLSGLFSTMSMPDLIQWGRTAQRTGVLTLESSSSSRLEVVFRSGRVIFTSTNSRRENYSRYLVFRRYCTQSDIDQALELQKRSGVMMAANLVRMGRLSEGEAIATLTEKTFEDICNVFLWPEGRFVFDPVRKPPASFLPIDVDPIEVVMEGVRRLDMWSQMSASLHPRSMFEANDRPFPDDQGAVEWEDREFAELIRPMLDGTETIEGLIGKLPFSRYKIYLAVFELAANGLIQPGDATSAGDREARLRAKLLEAENAAGEGRFTEAMGLLQGLVAAHPGREDLVERLMKVAESFRESVYRENFSRGDIPVVTVGLEALSHLRLEPTDGFILSRIDGRLEVQEILRIVPVREFEALRSLKRLLDSKVIDFPLRTMNAKENPVAGRKV